MDAIYVFTAGASTVGKIGLPAVVDPATGKVTALAGTMAASTEVVGIVMSEASAAGEPVEVACHGAVVKAVASAAIKKGAPINVAAASGVGYNSTAVKLIGRCLEEAKAAGDMVDILVLA